MHKQLKESKISCLYSLYLLKHGFSDILLTIFVDKNRCWHGIVIYSKRLIKQRFRRNNVQSVMPIILIVVYKTRSSVDQRQKAWAWKQNRVVPR